MQVNKSFSLHHESMCFTYLFLSSSESVWACALLVVVVVADVVVVVGVIVAETAVITLLETAAVALLVHL